MKTLTVVIAMALAVPLYAETYSWVDNQGIYNYSDDLSRVPKQYRKKAVKRGDLGKNDQQPVVLPELQTPKAQKEQTSQKEDVKSSGKDSADGKQLYGGKSHDEWQKEFGRQETELKQMELELAKIRQTISSSRITKEKQAALIKEFGTLQAEYKLKYGKYGELVEAAKKTGMTIEKKNGK